MPDGFVSISAAHAEAFPVAGESGLTLRLYRLRGAHAGRPVVLFGHACGFAAGSYLPLLLALSEFADVFAFDARGHGGSDAPADDPSIYTPDHYARDLAHIRRAVDAQAGERPVVYVGHSLGAATMLRLGSKHSSLLASFSWHALVLFEPPIFPSADRPEHAEALEKDRLLIQRTIQRRTSWPSPAAFVDSVSGRGAFRRMQPAFLRAHAEATLRPACSGAGFELCCPPAVEVATYRGIADDATFRALAGFPRGVPLHLVAGDASTPAERSWVSLMAPAIAARLAVDPDGRGSRRFTAWPGRGHLIIQEDSELTQRLIREALPRR